MGSGTRTFFSGVGGKGRGGEREGERERERERRGRKGAYLGGAPRIPSASLRRSFERRAVSFPSVSPGSGAEAARR